VINISVICVVEKKPEVFNLIKNMLGEANIFLYGLSNFSDLSNIYPFIDLLVLGDYNIYTDTILPDNIKSILLNTDNSRNLRLNKNTQIITCGLKEKDTAIFSSINLDEDEKSVILDLQRSIKNINGEILEPFEKQIYIHDFTENAKIKFKIKIKAEDLILALTALTFCGMI